MPINCDLCGQVCNDPDKHPTMRALPEAMTCCRCDRLGPADSCEQCRKHWEPQPPEPEDT